MTITALKVCGVTCSSFLVVTILGFVMAMVAGIKFVAARETNSTMALVMLTRQQRLYSNCLLLLRPYTGLL